MSKYKLDLNTVLHRLSTKDRKFYERLTDEEKKSFSGIVMMRFLSSSSGQMADYHLIATNEIANPYFHEMYDHPELQYLILSAASSGKNARYNWIKGTAKQGDALLMGFISKFWTEWNKMERELILSQFDKKSFDEFVDGTGIDAEEGKKLKKSFKVYRGL